jgi:hypothetical protein
LDPSQLSAFILSLGGLVEYVEVGRDLVHACMRCDVRLLC